MSVLTAGNDPARTNYGTERLAALTDGVFAITLTLLVLDLKVPHVAGGSEQVLREELVALIPNAVAWLVSFVLLARFWIIHHMVLETLERVELRTIIYNFGVLMLISLVPFATALLGTYEFEIGPVVVFSTVMALTGLATGLFASHAVTHPAMNRPHVRPLLRWHSRYHSIGIPIFAVFAIAMTLLAHPVLALIAWLGEPAIALTLRVIRARQ